MVERLFNNNYFTKVASKKYPVGTKYASTHSGDIYTSSGKFIGGELGLNNYNIVWDEVTTGIVYRKDTDKIRGSWAKIIKE